MFWVGPLVGVRFFDRGLHRRTHLIDYWQKQFVLGVDRNTDTLSNHRVNSLSSGLQIIR